MKPVVIDPLDDPRWDTLADRCGPALFMSSSWMTVLANTYDFDFRAAVFEDPTTSALVAGVPYCVVDDARGRRVRALPFSDLIEIPAETAEQRLALHRHLAELGLPTDLITPAAHAPTDEPWLATPTHVWHTNTIAGADAEELMQRCRPRIRTHIRKADREGFRVWADDSPAAVDDYFGLHLGVRKHRHHLLPQPRSMFHEVAKAYVENGNGWIIKVERDGTLASAAVALRHGDRLYYKFSASDPDHRHLGTNHAVVFGTYRHGLEIGASVVDLGRTPLDQPGLVEFKERLGADAAPVVRSSIRRRDDDAAADELGATLGRLTKLFIDPAVPDAITESAGDELYRYFA